MEQNEEQLKGFHRPQQKRLQLSQNLLAVCWTQTTLMKNQRPWSKILTKLHMTFSTRTPRIAINVSKDD